MNNRDRKRHEERKARQARAAWGTEPGLRGTKMLVLPLVDGVQVRRVEIDTTDPIDAVARWGRRALLEAAPVECLRVVAFKNWNDDERELLEIPEAREYARRLWADGRDLLRLLSESMWSPVPDDTYGIPAEVASAFGMGWLDVYLLGFCDVLEQELATSTTGPVYNVAMAGMDDARRAALRGELLEVSEATPEGVSFDAARARTAFAEANVESIHAAARRLVDEGQVDYVVLVLSLLDWGGRQLAVSIDGEESVRGILRRCQADDLHPGAVFVAPREATAKLLADIAPQSAHHLQTPAPAGSFWTVTLASGGTQVGRVQPQEAKA